MGLLPFARPKTDFALFVFIPIVFFIVAGGARVAMPTAALFWPLLPRLLLAWGGR
jgi:hypothetical protein